MHVMSKSTVEGYRDEVITTVHILQDMFDSHVVNSFYATSEVNKKLNDALRNAERALMNVYQIVDERNEKF